jgi:hypothetical protein
MISSIVRAFSIEGNGTVFGSGATLNACPVRFGFNDEAKSSVPQSSRTASAGPA